MPLRVAIQRAYFGRRAFGATQGVMLLFLAIPSATGNMFAGWVFDAAGGSYVPAFLTAILFWAMAIVPCLSVKPPTLKLQAHAAYQG